MIVMYHARFVLHSADNSKIDVRDDVEHVVWALEAVSKFADTFFLAENLELDFLANFIMLQVGRSIIILLLCCCSTVCVLTCHLVCVSHSQVQLARKFSD